MNRIGVSSACFYPLETEKSLAELGELGIGVAELFINSPSETEGEKLQELIDIKKSYGIDVVSVHPFMSFAESNFLFSSYKRRFTDFLPFYDRFFEVCAMLDAKYFVFHGMRPPRTISEEEYFERFGILTALGRKNGIQVCIENVVHFFSQEPDHILRMQNYIGETFGMVLDIKQARRADVSHQDFIEKLHPYIRHIHISDFTDQTDCAAPLSGKFDFQEFFSLLKAKDYQGDYIIELYKESYQNEDDIRNAYKNLQKILP